MLIDIGFVAWLSKTEKISARHVSLTNVPLVLLSGSMIK